jgi:hypothetical protein
MRLISVLLLALVLTPLGPTSSSGRIIAAHGVRLVVPAEWHRVRAASDAPVTDPLTLLVVGTHGVHSRASQCQIAAYRVPPTAAVVVIVGWSSVASAGGAAPSPGRAPLKKLVAVRRPTLECFSGRGAAADVLLRGKPFQINAMVGNRASKQRIAEALTVARSFDLTR